MDLKKIIRLSYLTALMIVLGMIENYIPLLNGIIPGFKIGFANIIVLILLYSFSFKEAFLASILRVLVVSLITTGFGTNFLFSICGAIVSIIAMVVSKKTKLSIIGVSMVGSIFHVVSQILVAVLIFQNTVFFYYLPILIIISIITGSIIGFIAKEIINHINDLKI